MTDWQAWHRQYDEPGSRLSRRLEVVRRRLNDALDRMGPHTPHLLALCAGDARDVVPVLTARANGGQVDAVLVELDEKLASRAAQSAMSAGLGKVVVRRGDAGDPTSFRDVVPVDVLMICGVFGNLEHTSVLDTVRALPALVVPGGYVIWTRGGGPPEDHRPEVRRWFVESGMPEVSFDGEPETYGVGLNQILTRSTAVQAGRLFTFRASKCSN